MAERLQLAVQAVEVAAQPAEQAALLAATGVAHIAASRDRALGAGDRAALGRGQTTGGATVISMPARHAHAAKPKSDGEAEAQSQGLQHGRILSLANVKSRVAIPAGRFA